MLLALLLACAALGNKPLASFTAAPDAQVPIHVAAIDDEAAARWVDATRDVMPAGAHAEQTYQAPCAPDAATLRTWLAVTPPAGRWIEEPGPHDGVCAVLLAVPGLDLRPTTVAVTNDPVGLLTVRLTLSEADRAALTALTTAVVKRRVAIVIEGRVYSTPLVLEPITGEEVHLAPPDGTMPQADVEAFARWLAQGGTPPTW